MRNELVYIQTQSRNNPYHDKNCVTVALEIYNIKSIHVSSLNSLRFGIHSSWFGVRASDQIGHILDPHRPHILIKKLSSAQQKWACILSTALQAQRTLSSGVLDSLYNLCFWNTWLMTNRLAEWKSAQKIIDRLFTN